MAKVNRLLGYTIVLTMLCGMLVGCGGEPANTDPKALADEAAKLDQKAAEGEKGL